MKKRIAVTLLTAALLAALIYACLERDNVIRALEPSLKILVVSELEDGPFSVASGITAPDGSPVNTDRAEKDQR